MKNKNNNQNEFERLGGQKSGGGGYIPPIPPLDPPLYSEQTKVFAHHNTHVY